MADKSLSDRIDEHTLFLRNGWAVEKPEAHDSTYDLLRTASAQLKQTQQLLAVSRRLASTIKANHSGWWHAYATPDEIEMINLVDSIDEVEPEPANEYRCCPTHCCQVHGCKYGLDGCPVATKIIKGMTGSCEDCGLTQEGYYGDEAKQELYRQLTYTPGVQIRLKGNPLDEQLGQYLDSEAWYKIEDTTTEKCSQTNYCIKINGHWVDSAWIDVRHEPKPPAK